jgi:hypothetical protein
MSLLSRAGSRLTTPPATDDFGYTSQKSVVQQETALAAKLAAKAERSAVRRDRFLDARQRTIGVRVRSADSRVAVCCGVVGGGGVACPWCGVQPLVVLRCRVVGGA